MRHLMIYENIDKEPKLSDYVIVKPKSNRALSEAWRNWFRTHLGKIINIKGNRWFKDYYVQFETASGDREVIRFVIDEIEDFSSDIEDLQYFLQANKYNL